MKNTKAFFDSVRNDLAARGGLTESQVAGLNTIVKEGERRELPLNMLAYIMATAYWETGKTFAHVEEGFYLGSRAESFQRGLRYAPYHGRGWSQLTWDYNYKKAGDMLGIDLVSNPDLALIPENSSAILFWGMTTGAFTGKSMADYIDTKDESDQEDLREFANARRVVNGTDRQVEIGKIALTFERALKAGGYLGEEPIVEPEPEPLPDFLAELDAYKDQIARELDAIEDNMDTFADRVTELEERVDALEENLNQIVLSLGARLKALEDWRASRPDKPPRTPRPPRPDRDRRSRKGGDGNTE